MYTLIDYISHTVVCFVWLHRFASIHKRAKTWHLTLSKGYSNKSKICQRLGLTSFQDVIAMLCQANLRFVNRRNVLALYQQHRSVAFNTPWLTLHLTLSLIPEHPEKMSGNFWFPKHRLRTKTLLSGVLDVREIKESVRCQTSQTKKSFVRLTNLLGPFCQYSQDLSGFVNHTSIKGPRQIYNKSWHQGAKTSQTKKSFVRDLLLSYGSLLML